MQTIEIRKKDELDYQSSEAYKSLRTNVQFSGEDIKVIALTSCTPNEGKTSVSLNLAISLAETDKRVLYIDADMRKSVLVGRYRLANASFGLSHYLSGMQEQDEVVADTNVEGLHLIVAGPVPPNPAELLEGKRFRELVQSAREKYDYVIIDTPPLGSVIDSVIVARECDGIAMVIAADEISYKFAQRVKAQLEVAECKIIGVILNKVDIRQGGHYGYGGKYYGGYYKKYYGKYYGNYYGGEEYRKEEDSCSKTGKSG